MRRVREGQQRGRTTTQHNTTQDKKGLKGKTRKGRGQRDKKETRTVHLDPPLPLLAVDRPCGGRGPRGREKLDEDVRVQRERGGLRLVVVVDRAREELYDREREVVRRGEDVRCGGRGGSARGGEREGAEIRRGDAQRTIVPAPGPAFVSSSSRSSHAPSPARRFVSIATSTENPRSSAQRSALTAASL